MGTLSAKNHYRTPIPAAVWMLPARFAPTQQMPGKPILFVNGPLTWLDDGFDLSLHLKPAGPLLISTHRKAACRKDKIQDGLINRGS